MNTFHDCTGMRISLLSWTGLGFHENAGVLATHLVLQNVLIPDLVMVLDHRLLFVFGTEVWLWPDVGW
jgi:hypothetical protein